MDGPSTQGWWWRLRRRLKEGGGAADAAGCVEGLCSLPLRGRQPCRAEGDGIAPWAMFIKSALRDLLSVSYGMIGILLIGSLRSPPPIRLRHWTLLWCES